jgi:Cyclic GMP-AMP synthase DncV-like, nucleotidyltransferase domain
MSSRTPEALRVELIMSALKSISLPPGVYRKAIDRYDALTKFLDDPKTLIGSWHPDMYIQGSAALGTANKPPGRDDFDFDVTCETQPPSTLTAMSVRDALEKRLREDANYSRMLNTEKNRCLRLDYAKEEQFHLDIIVARSARWVSATGTGIQVPDGQIAQWVWSDPRGFIAWFENRKQVLVPVTYLGERNRKTLITAGADPAPEQPELTEKVPLQWVIQIMKRHRDLRFIVDAAKDAPISIILTTLAAKAYAGEANLDDALAGITDRLLDQFDDAERWIVCNPVIPKENFADKWPAKPHRRAAFFKWYEQFKRDVGAYLEATKIGTIAESLKALVGERAKIRAFSAHSELMNEMQRRSQLGVLSVAATIVPASTPGSRVIPAHTNYGTY